MRESGRGLRPAHLLAKLGAAGLLRGVFTEVLVPSAVYDEVVSAGDAADHADATIIRSLVERGDLRLVPFGDEMLPDDLKDPALGAGEKQAIALSLVERPDWLLLDDANARRNAGARGLPVKGTLGVIVEAVRSMTLPLPEAITLIQTIQTTDDIWIDANVCQTVLDHLQQGNA